MSLKVIPHQSSLHRKQDTITGFVKNIEKKERTLEFTVEISRKESLKAIIPSELEISLIEGDYIEGKGVLKEFENNTIPNSFSYKKYLSYQNIFYQMEIKQIKVLKNANWFYQMKHKIRQFVEQKKRHEYYELLLFGRKENFSKELYSLFQTNGISHLFVISGMHFSFLRNILNKILTKFIKKTWKKDSIILIILFFYFLLLPKTPSILRAFYFLFFQTINQYNPHKVNANILFLLSIGLILFQNPFSLYFVGFQYTTVISFGLLLIKKQKSNFLLNCLKITGISFLLSLPITASCFYEINLFSIIVNLFMVSFVSVVFFPTMLLSFLLPFFNMFFEPLIVLLEWLNQIFYHFRIMIILPKIPIIWFLIYYFLLFVIIKYQKKRFFLLLGIFIISWKVSNHFNPTGNYYFIDVGQGDCSLIVSPYQKDIILIDTGGSEYGIYHISDQYIRFFKSLGLNHIDVLYLSHGDTDHAGEIFQILENFPIKKVIINKGDDNPIEQKLKKDYSEKIAENYHGKRVKITNIFHRIADNENDNSLILNVCMFQYCTLYMGDASSKVEEELIRNYQIKAQFLKVGHHGSKTSSHQNFLNNIHPKFAFISVGKKNRYRHPSIDTINRLNKEKIIIKTTKDFGTIQLQVSKKSYTLFYNPP